MAIPRNKGSDDQREWRTLLATYGLCIGAIVMAVGAYKLPTVSLASIRTVPGFLLVIGFAICAAGIYVILSEWRRSRNSSGHSIIFVTITALTSVVLLLGAGEGMLRVMVVKDVTGERVGNVALAPTWTQVRERNLILLETATPSGSWEEPFLVFDEVRGWVVGEDRASADGMYLSSAEGIRSGIRGIRFSDRRPSHRVAILGDSNTFSLEVDFDQSWGFLLENELGEDTQVLNFGVNGYGIDQAVLHYEIDAQQWSPDIVILAFIEHDLTRSVVVYPFVSFPPWQMPFAKPRFIVENGGLVTVNTPLTEPKLWFTDYDISELPFIELDMGYRSALWSTRVDGYPLLARLFTTLFPRYPPRRDLISDDEKIELNSALFSRFFDRVSGDAIPLLVYFPTKGAGDFDSSGQSNLTRRTLSHAGLPFLDLTECLIEIADEDRLVPSGNHFSPLANREIARCLAPEVSLLLKTKSAESGL